MKFQDEIKKRIENLSPLISHFVKDELKEIYRMIGIVHNLIKLNLKQQKRIVEFIIEHKGEIEKL